MPKTNQGTSVVTREMEPLHQRAMFTPESYDEKERTIEVVVATETPVRTFTWEDGTVNEVLSMTTGAIRMQRMNAGAPLLNSHKRYSLNDTIGVVVEGSARIEGGVLKAKVKFSSREDVAPIINDVKEGILRNISVGYRVYKYTVTKREGSLPEYRADDWEPFEVSLVSVPADPNAGVRSQEQLDKYPVEIVRSGQPTQIKPPHKTMTKEQMRAEIDRLKALESRTADEDAQLRQLEADLATAERAASPTPTPAPAPAPTPSPAPDNSEAVRAAERAAERTRITNLTALCRAAGKDEKFINEHVESGTSLDAIRTLLTDEMIRGERKIASASVSVGAEQSDKFREAVGDALLLRVDGGRTALDADGGKNQKRIDAAREFRGMSLLRMAEECLIQAGENTRGMSKEDIAKRAMNTRTYHTTSDFPIILGNTFNKRLLAQYDLAPRTFQSWARRNDAPDFRDQETVRLDGLSPLKEVFEGAEYKYGTVGESAEKWRVKKYGEIVAITWEMIINDNMNAFSRVPGMLAEEVAQLQSDIVYSILSTNANMSDGNALFSTAHANLAASGADITVDAIAAARKAIRIQTNSTGRQLNLDPQFLIVGPEKETKAQQLLQAVIVATKVADTNVFRGSLDLIVEGRLTGNEWYLACSPARIDTIEYGFLAGQPEIYTEQREGFNVDGIEIKVRSTFGAKAIDWKGLYKNGGA